jgi:hypothetical protein
MGDQCNFMAFTQATKEPDRACSAHLLQYQVDSCLLGSDQKRWSVQGSWKARPVYLQDLSPAGVSVTWIGVEEAQEELMYL